MKRENNTELARTMIEELGSMTPMQLLKELHGLLPLENHNDGNHFLACGIYVELNHRLTLAERMDGFPTILEPSPQPRFGEHLLEGKNINQWKSYADSLEHQAGCFEQQLIAVGITPTITRTP